MIEYTIEAYESKADIDDGEEPVDVWDVNNENEIADAIAEHVPECEYARILVDDVMYGEVHRKYIFTKVDDDKPKKLPLEG